MFPSLNETFGLVSLEAMEWKLPVVSTDEGAIRDVVKDGENGLISEKQNPQSLAACLERLMNDKALRERMGEEGYRRFKQQFTLAAFEQQFVQCVSKTLTGGVILSLIRYHGRKYGAEKEAFWQQADIFVFPTHYSNECFPLVLLEAMQHGVPCISTREGGIEGIVRDGESGLLVERNNDTALAVAIEKLLGDAPLRQAMGQKGRAAYEEHFTLRAFEHRMAKVLKVCVSSGSVRCS